MAVIDAAVGGSAAVPLARGATAVAAAVAGAWMGMDFAAVGGFALTVIKAGVGGSAAVPSTLGAGEVRAWRWTTHCTASNIQYYVRMRVRVGWGRRW